MERPRPAGVELADAEDGDAGQVAVQPQGAAVERADSGRGDAPVGGKDERVAGVGRADGQQDGVAVRAAGRVEEGADFAGGDLLTRQPVAQPQREGQEEQEQGQG